MEKYRLTYPEKNISWTTNKPNNCMINHQKECSQKMLYTPTPASQCKSTFMPWDRPDPNECLKLCGKKNPFTITACKEEAWKFPRCNNNGCLMEPSAAQYTNISFQNRPNESTSILTDPNRNPPYPPQYGYKDSSAYDPIAYVYGKSYTF